MEVTIKVNECSSKGKQLLEQLRRQFFSLLNPLLHSLVYQCLT